jgi:hypothetical protein
MSSISVRPPRFEAVTVAVRGSLRRRSSLENRMRALSASTAPPSPPDARPGGQAAQQHVRKVVQVDVVDKEEVVDKEKEKGDSRGGGQGASGQTTSKTGVASQHQPKLRRDPFARTRHIRLRRRLPGHPGSYSLPRSVADRGVADRVVADRTGHRVGHHWRLLPNDRSPAPGAHPSRGGNLRRALTTPHLHSPSRRPTL